MISSKSTLIGVFAALLALGGQAGAQASAQPAPDGRVYTEPSKPKPAPDIELISAEGSTALALNQLAAAGCRIVFVGSPIVASEWIPAHEGTALRAMRSGPVPSADREIDQILNLRAQSDPLDANIVGFNVDSSTAIAGEPSSMHLNAEFSFAIDVAKRSLVSGTEAQAKKAQTALECGGSL